MELCLMITEPMESMISLLSRGFFPSPFKAEYGGCTNRDRVLCIAKEGRMPSSGILKRELLS